jgi:CopG family nickel-responsive transcriptional regulator
MTEELTRLGVSVPDNLLRYFDELLVENGHSSRSDAVRDALRRYIQYHEWMNDVRGKRIGIYEMVYSPLKKGLPASISNILGESKEIVLSSILIHLNNDDYLHITIMYGEARNLVELAEKLMALKGVKQEKLITAPLIE